jgi:hypothetical protein
MSTIVTRSGKGSPLTHNEVDANFTNLNTDKYQEGSAIGAVTPAAGTFTTLTATTGVYAGGAGANVDLNVYSKGTGNVNIGTGNGTQFRVESSGSAATDFVMVGGSNSGRPFIRSAATSGNIDLAVSSQGTGAVRLYTNFVGQEQFRVSHTASAVNYVQVTGAATGGTPFFLMAGSDANIGMVNATKGTGAFGFWTNSGSNQQFGITHTASAVNRLQVTGSAANSAPILSSVGSDTNISQVFQSKGTGAIDLAAGSSGVNISNGGTVTAITGTNIGASYTSFPSVVISAPTTAGGVQATASLVGMISNNPVTIVAGGTGYTAGDTLTVVGGTPVSGAATLTVNSVSGGVITAVFNLNFAGYTVLPTNPVSVTGGTGSGATFNLTYSPRFASGFTITNAGSGYVEQPTVTFSGGGGSGAAAYATVGSGTTVRSIGSTMSFNTPGGEALRVADLGGTVVAGLGVFAGSSSQNSVYLTPYGSVTNGNLIIAAKGTQFVAIGTNANNNSNAIEQMRVAHTASAVNYVQVTGAATGGEPVISTQGSDSNIRLILRSKGSLGIRLQDAVGNTSFATATGGGSNFLQVAGTATGVAPSLVAAGGDTNIPLVLQPKGTGALQAQQTDSTATGGNARGANAVDWQTTRGAASQVASGAVSFIGGGQNNTSSSYGTVVCGGANSSATGANTFVGAGTGLTSSGAYAASVGGAFNTAAGQFNFIGGGANNSGTALAAVTTQSATMNATTAVTLSGSNANIKVGQYISGTSIGFGTYVAAISGTSLTLSQAASGSSTSTLSFFTPHGVVVGGGNNQATGSYSFIGGGGDAGTAANRNVASGDWSVVGGGQKNTASAIYSFVGGGGGNTTAQTGAVVCGGGAFGGNPSSFLSNTASGLSSFIGAGLGNSTDSSYSAVIAGVYGRTRGIQCNHVFAASNNPMGSFQSGQAQAALVVLGKQTTDATPTAVTIDGNAGATTNQVILPNNSAYFFRGEVVSGVTGGGNSKSWTIEGLIKRGANAASTTLVGVTVMSPFGDVGAATWTIAVTADTTNGGLAVTFTGQAATTIRTVAQIRTTEMTY